MRVAFLRFKLRGLRWLFEFPPPNMVMEIRNPGRPHSACNMWSRNGRSGFRMCMTQDQSWLSIEVEDPDCAVEEFNIGLHYTHAMQARKIAQIAWEMHLATNHADPRTGIPAD